MTFKVERVSNEEKGAAQTGLPGRLPDDGQRWRDGREKEKVQ